MKNLNNETLILTDVREAIGSERETGVEAVFTYTCEETDHKIKIHASGRFPMTGMQQWLPEDQKNQPESVDELLATNFPAVNAWHAHGIKHVREYHVIEMA